MNTGNGGTVFPSPTFELNAYKLGINSMAIDACLDLMNLYSINSGRQYFFNNSIITGLISDIGAHEGAAAIMTAVAINKNKKEGDRIYFYPNPVQSGNPISVIAAELPYSAELISMTGGSVWKDVKINSQTYSIPTMNLASGTYFLVTIDNNGRQKVNKLIIE